MIDLNTIISNLPGHVYWKNTEGVYLGCNQTQAEHLGLSSSEDVIGKTLEDLPISARMANIFHANDRAVISSGIARLVEEPYLTNGAEKLVLSHKIPLFNKSNEVIGLLGVSVDITDYKEYEKKLEREKKYVEIALENIVERLPANVYWLDRNNVYLGCNHSHAKSAGLPSSKFIIGKSNHDLPWNQYATEINTINTLVMEQGIEHSTEETVRLADGTEKTMLSKKVPLHDDENNIIGVLGISIDLSAQKKLERLLREQIDIEVERSQLMKTLGGSIAHELRTPLSSIKSVARFLERKLPAFIEGYKKLPGIDSENNTQALKVLEKLETAPGHMLTSSISASQIIDTLLMNIKEKIAYKKCFKLCSMKEIIKKAISEYAFDGSDKKLVTWSNKEDFAFYGDKLLIKHILFNLLKNAIYHIKAAKKGSINISVENDHRKKNLLRFRDTGKGIEKEYLELIFDRFVSQRHGGTGLGLAFCKMVMSSLGGNIRCDSIVGEYTEFVLTFPSCDHNNQQHQDI